MCMLDCFVREKLCDAFVVHINHGLRGQDSDRDEQFVRQACERYGIPCVVYYADVQGYRTANRISSVEQAARMVRRGIFRELLVQGECDRILTAHQADDFAESILMHMMRGCGWYGLQGIPEDDGHFLRPLIEKTRAQIDAYMKEHVLGYRDDATNADVAIIRNYVRAEILPRMEHAYAGSTRHMLEMGKRMQRLHRSVERQLGAPVLRAGGVVLDTALLQNSPWAEYAVTRALRIVGAQIDVHAEQIAAMLALKDAKTGACVRQGGDAAAYRERDGVVIEHEIQDPARYYPIAPGNYAFVHDTVTISADGYVPSDAQVHMQLDTALLGKACLRTPQEGDYVRIGEHTKTLRAFLSDHGVALRLRERIPVCAAGKRVLAVLDADACYCERPAPDAKVLTLAAHRSKFPAALPFDTAAEVSYWKRLE